MSQINPFTYTVVQNIDAQRRGAIEKERQLRRAKVMEKDIAAREDELEHQVESAEETLPVQDEDNTPKRRPKRQAPRGHGAPDDQSDDNPHIDLTA